MLLPMQSACGDFLARIGMKDTVDTAAASCPAPLDPCTNYPEFMAYQQTVRHVRPSHACWSVCDCSCLIYCVCNNMRR